MKMQGMRFGMRFAAVFTVVIGLVQSVYSAPPTTGDSITSAGSVIPSTSDSVTSVGPRMMSAASIDRPTVTITPVLLPALTSPSWPAAADKVVTDAKNGTVKIIAATVTSPTDYAVCGGYIGWSNLVYSKTSPMWAGHLNPLPPFDNERGQIIWQLIEVKSSADDISLDSLRVTSTSNDGDVLGTNMTFIGVSYSPRAIAIKSDGTVISSGPTSQKGSRIVVLTRLKLFDGGDTLPGLAAVRDWVGSFKPYSITYTAQISGGVSSATISTSGFTGSSPVVGISVDKLFIRNAVEGKSYKIYSRQNVGSGSWQLFAVLNGNQAIDIPFTASTTQFYLAVMQ